MKYTVVASLLGRFEEKLNSFIHKFNVYGDGNFSYTVSDKYAQILKDGRTVYYVDIDVEGSYQINGYEFVASLEYDDDSHSNIIKTAGNGIEIPSIYYTRNACDHCGVERYRKYTVLLRNIETGEFVQVGKSCVRDYLGVDIENYARYFAMWETLSEYEDSLNSERSGIRESVAFSVTEILCQTVAVAKQYGYVSKATAYEDDKIATSTVIWHIMNKSTNRYGELMYPAYSITPEIEDTVSLILKMIDECEEDSAYVHDLKVLCAKDYVDAEHLGLVVSAVGFYFRSLRTRKAREESTSSYIGNIGDKVTFSAIGECVCSWEGDYGTTYVYKFIVDGNEIIWKTSKYLGDAELTIKATIKELSEYKGVKQTVITRGKVI